MNMAQNNFHSANSSVDITQALDNLDMEEISDRDIVAQLTKINQQLTTTNTNLSAQLKTVLATNAALVANSTLHQPTTLHPPRPPWLLLPQHLEDDGHHLIGRHV